jgi:hypothetical protein
MIQMSSVDGDADGLPGLDLGKSELQDAIGEAGLDGIRTRALGTTQDLLVSGGSLRRVLVTQPDKAILDIETKLLAFYPGDFEAGIVMTVIFEPLHTAGERPGSGGPTCRRWRRAKERSKGTERIPKKGFPIIEVSVSDQFHGR